MRLGTQIFSFSTIMINCKVLCGGAKEGEKNEIMVKRWDGMVVETLKVVSEVYWVKGCLRARWPLFLGS